MLCLCLQLCALLDATLVDHPRLNDPQVIESLFIYCVVWSIGSCLVQQPESPVSGLGCCVQQHDTLHTFNMATQIDLTAYPIY